MKGRSKQGEDQGEGTNSTAASVNPSGQRTIKGEGGRSGGMLAEKASERRQRIKTQVRP